MDPVHICHLDFVVDPRRHQISHDHPILEVFLQVGSEFLLVEEVLVIFEVYAWLALDSSDDLEVVKLVFCEELFEKVQEGGPEGGQEVLGGVRLLLSFSLLFLLFLLLQEVFPLLFFEVTLLAGGGISLGI